MITIQDTHRYIALNLILPLLLVTSQREDIVISRI